MLQARLLSAAIAASGVFVSVAFGSVVVTDSTTLATTNIAPVPRTVVADGVSVTFTAAPGDGMMQVDSDGVYLQGIGDLLGVTFDTNVQVTGYSIGFNNSPITGNIEFYVNDGDSIFEPGITTGSYSLSTPFTVNVGDVLWINGNVSDISQLKSLTFAVPEPSSALITVGVLLGSGMLRRRGRSDQTLC